jgi:thiamine biosynthesis lipoprotein
VIATESGATFECFGSACSVFVTGDGDAGSAGEAVDWARGELRRWHGKFTRFEPDSELSRLNADPRPSVRVSPEMVRFAQLVQQAASLSNGLVDATLLGEIESAGYTTDLGEPASLRDSLRAAPGRRAATASPASRWRELFVDAGAGMITRPPGRRLDSGGLAKGLFCDLLAETLESHDAYAVDCAGDVRVGGTRLTPRLIQVASPFEDRILQSFESSSVAAATSGIGRRSWHDVGGRPAHHLLDPSTGLPAFTGVVQATALAPTAALAEICAKAAILSGPEVAAGWLPLGGVVVYDDGTHEVVE